MNRPIALAVCLALTLACATTSRTAEDSPPDNPLGVPGPVGLEAVTAYVEQGTEALPELRLYLDDPDALVRYRAKTALGRITGQWGADGTGIQWERSLADAETTAAEDAKPLLLLHLFGKLDEEFC